MPRARREHGRAHDRRDRPLAIASTSRAARTAGSVFVNPVPGEVSAGSLIDGLGLRGLRIGTAWVSEKHANFMQAADGGSGGGRPRAVIEADRERVAAATASAPAQRKSKRVAWWNLSCFY